MLTDPAVPPAAPPLTSDSDPVLPELEAPDFRDSAPVTPATVDAAVATLTDPDPDSKLSPLLITTEPPTLAARAFPADT
jgi:hypothetical protein